jgi:thiamine-phosphate diphosphorylase
VQVRERDLPGRELVALVRALVALADGSPTRILVNDRLDLAIAAGAAGVHLRGDSIAPAKVRTVTPPGFVIGRSVHDADEARRLDGDVDYFIAGPVWPTPSKPTGPVAHALLGTHGLAAVVAAARVPVLAIGGVTLDRIAQVAATGAAGIAAIGLFMPHVSPADKTTAHRTSPGDSPSGLQTLRGLAAALRARYDEVNRLHHR